MTRHIHIAAGLLAAWVGVAPLLSFPSTTRAQCTSNASSCVQCHEVRGLRPVLSDASRPWHVDHAFGDLCVGCHGGEPSESEAAAAHRGVRDPLTNARAACADCHADFEARASRYRLLAPPWPGAAAPAQGGPPGPPRSRTPPAAHAAQDARATNLLLVAVALLLAALVANLVRKDRNARRLRPSSWLTRARWSPYVAGAGLGIVVAISEAGFGRPLAAAGAFDKLAAYLGRALLPASPYYRQVMRPGITWQVWVIVGLVAGAFLSAVASKQARLRWLPDTQWVPRFGSSRPLRFLVAFVGAVLVQVGAGIAGGCTSGLAISGGAMMSPAAFLFMGAMFASGIPTAWLWYRGRTK